MWFRGCDWHTKWFDCQPEEALGDKYSSGHELATFRSGSGQRTDEEDANWNSTNRPAVGSWKRCQLDINYLLRLRKWPLDVHWDFILHSQNGQYLIFMFQLKLQRNFPMEKHLSNLNRSCVFCLSILWISRGNNIWIHPNWYNQVCLPHITNGHVHCVRCSSVIAILCAISRQWTIVGIPVQNRTERPSPPSPAELNDEDAKLLLSESVCTDTTQYDPINNLLFQLSKGANCIFSSAHYHPPPQSIDDWLGIPISGAAAALNWIDATDNLNECLNSKRRWQRFPGTKSHEIVSPTDPANWDRAAINDKDWNDYVLQFLFLFLRPPPRGWIIYLRHNHHFAVLSPRARVFGRVWLWAEEFILYTRNNLYK